MTTKHSTFSYDVAELRDLSPTERAQVRAIEDGRNARSTGHFAQYAVAPQVNRGYAYLCTVLGPELAKPVRVACNCASGVHRAHLDVPCRHAGRVIERLVREGNAQWVTGGVGDDGPHSWPIWTPKAVREARDRLQAELDVFESSDVFKSVFG